MNRDLFAAAAITLTGLAAPVTHASPINKGWIDPGTTWLVHVDVERLLSTGFGKFIARQIEEADGDEDGDVEVNIHIGADDDDAPADAPEGQTIEHRAEVRIGARTEPHAMSLDAVMPQSLREFREEFGFDPLSDVLSITMFGTDADAEKPTLLVHTTAAVDNAMKKLEQAEGVEISQMNGATVGRFTPEDGDTPKFVAIRPEADGTRLMFLAESIDDLARVLAPGGTARGPAWIAPAADTFIYLHATKNSPFAQSAVQSSMLRDAESIELNIGQRGNDMFIDGLLEAGAAEVAINMSQVGNGLLALARLGAMQSEMDDETRAALDLIKNLTIGVEGTAVHLNLSFDSNKLIRLMQEEAD